VLQPKHTAQASSNCTTISCASQPLVAQEAFDRVSDKVRPAVDEAVVTGGGAVHESATCALARLALLQVQEEALLKL
jgi:hypothetical protein